MCVDKNHVLLGGRWDPSEYHDERPKNFAIELVVLHCISLPEGQFGTEFPEQLFTGKLDVEADDSFADLRGVEVSPHLFVDRKGAITQFVSFDRRAWHAGISTWRKRPNCNDYSIGIELEGTDTDTFEPAQYETLAAVCAALMRSYPALSADRIAGHSEVAPGRMFDPGVGFDWDKFRQLMSAHLVVSERL